MRRGHPPSQGIWAIPGGKVELGETLAMAAEREVAEETSVRIEAGAVVHCFDSIHCDTAGEVEFHFVIVDVLGRYLTGEPVAGDDASDARWVSPQELLAWDVSEPTVHLLRDKLHFTGPPKDNT